MDLWIIFLTGLTVGGLTCLAVQGGLLASVITAREGEDFREGKQKRHTILSTIAFLFAKLLAYALLGFGLGSFGEVISISSTTQTVMQMVAGIYMIAVSLNLLNIHPIFRYVVFQPPKFLTRIVRNQSKSKELFAPFLLGAMTIFIPCGTTLAMEALAISTASGITGAMVMTVFVLGTMPLFFGIGFLTSLMGDAFKSKFLKLAAIAVMYLGITSVNGSLIALGSPLNLQTIAENFPVQIALGEQSADQVNFVSLKDGKQEVDLFVTSYGYNPNRIQVKRGYPVKLNLLTQDAYSCALAFRIPSLGIKKNLSPNGKESIEFTPTKAEKIPFSCSMGMYRGVIEVI